MSELVLCSGQISQGSLFQEGISRLSQVKQFSSVSTQQVINTIIIIFIIIILIIIIIIITRLSQVKQFYSVNKSAQSRLS